MPITLVPGPSIASQATISAPFQLTSANQNLAFIIMPPAWTPAPLTFQWSADGLTFFDLFDIDGREINFIGEPAGVIIPSSLVFQGLPLPWVKFRSGPRVSPIRQTAARQFQVVLQ